MQQLVLEFQRFKSVKAYRPKVSRQTAVNAKSSANSLNNYKNVKNSNRSRKFKR
ncbi:MAG: hypothetical protein LBP59_05760 [Planctomycetaceae bacterium]|nr:hypothetical protein [Planctomycetaceae bacterium]